MRRHKIGYAYAGSTGTDENVGSRHERAQDDKVGFRRVFVNSSISNESAIFREGDSARPNVLRACNLAQAVVLRFASQLQLFRQVPLAYASSYGVGLLTTRLDASHGALGRMKNVRRWTDDGRAVVI